MERHIILFDEGCGFCRWSLDRLLRWDRRGRLRAVPIQSEEGDRLLADLAVADRLASWHLVTPDGRRYSGGAATAPLARLLPAGAPVAIVAETFPAHDRSPLPMGGSQPGLAGHAYRRASVLGRSEPAIRPPYVELRDEPSITSVNGPSFNSSTSIIAPKTPRPTCTPRASSADASASTRSAATPGSSA